MTSSDNQEPVEGADKAPAEESGKSSYRSILRTSSIMGASSVANIVISLVRTKLVALLLGPTGIGLLGLLGNIMGTSATVAGLGLTAAGTRQIAAARLNGNPHGITIVRRSLLFYTVVLATLGGSLVFGFREQLATLAFGDGLRAAQVGWLALGVALTVASGSQGALLTGLRRIEDLAWLRITSAVLATVFGVGALLVWGDDAIIIIVLVPPAASFVLGHWFVSRLDHVRAKVSWAAIRREGRQMAALGVPIMLAGLIELLSPLFIRVSIQRELGTDSLGHFQASWAIGQTYLGFVLGAMSTDYFPRLSGCLQDEKTARRLVNEQAEVALVLAGPVILALMAVAPWVVTLLYSDEFSMAAKMLQWQLYGDIFRVIGWPVSFILLAAGMGTVHMIKIAASNIVLVGSTLYLLTSFGIVGAGMAFSVMTILHLPVIWWLARRRIDFRWSKAAVKDGSTLVLAGTVVLALGQWSDVGAALVGIPIAIAMGIYSLRKLTTMADLSGPLGKLTRLGQRWLAKFTR